MKRYKFTPVKIEMQGAPILSSERAFIVKKRKDLVALSIDLKSKNCQVGATYSSSDGSCGVDVEATEHSLYLYKSKDLNDFTLITFPKFKGWKVFASSSGRYNIDVCLIRGD